MDIETALDWASQRTVGTLITIRNDGRPQSSDVAYRIHDGTIIVSLTETRAKTRNIAADPRVVLHVSNPRRVVVRLIRRHRRADPDHTRAGR